MPPASSILRGTSRVCRLTATNEELVRGAIAAALERFEVGFGFGSLASGADILFAEELLARRN